MKRNLKTMSYGVLTATILCMSLNGCTTASQAGNNSNITTQAQQNDAITPETPRFKKPAPLMQDGDNILFVGNSHTYVNNLPYLFAGLTEAAGYTIGVYECTEGSYYLKQFADPSDEMGSVLAEALENYTWDFVVLQENTNGALNADKEMKKPAGELDTLIKKAGGQTAFLMTWAAKDDRLFSSHEKLQDVIAQGYYSVADELDALLIPGGIAFTETMEKAPEIELWGDDGQHATPEGTYLAACTAYAVLFQETPVGIPYYGEATEETAQTLQQIAADLVLGETE